MEVALPVVGGIVGPMDVVIKEGTIVNGGEIFKADVGLQGGKIACIGHDLQGDENIDATGRYLFPGVIDVQTRMELPWGNTRSADNFFSGTRSAACGGITTILDLAVPAKGQSLTEAVTNRRRLADPQVVVDYALHPVVTEAVPDTLDEVRELIRSGYPTILVDLLSRGGLDDGFLIDLFAAIHDEGGLAVVVPGNAAVHASLSARFLRDGKTSPDFHPLSRPAYAEEEAAFRAIAWARATGVSLHLSQVSTQAATGVIMAARDQGLPVYADTSPHHLLLTEQRYASLDGQQYVVDPPLRDKPDLEGLWKALRSGDIQIVTSGHFPFTIAQKQLGDSFATTPSGFPGCETLLPLLYTEGVVGKRLTLCQLVNLLSSFPADLFGLPDKGAIAVGKDADLVIFNPLERRILTAAMLHSESDFTPFDGWELQGFPETTFARGRIVFDHGKYSGEKGSGQYVERSL